MLLLSENEKLHLIVYIDENFKFQGFRKRHSQSFLSWPIVEVSLQHYIVIQDTAFTDTSNSNIRSAHVKLSFWQTAEEDLLVTNVAF